MFLSTSHHRMGAEINLCGSDPVNIHVYECALHMYMREVGTLHVYIEAKQKQHKIEIAADSDAAMI